MRAKLFAASLFTLGILSGFVFTILFTAAYFGGKMQAGIMVGLTIAVNAVMWLVSPWLTDLMQGWIYKIEKVEFSDFERRFPAVAKFMKTTCEKHRLNVPALRLIHDKNPTAYCYGSYPSNARLVLSEGIFYYLNDEEACAVVGHELGHIVNKDFIVMTIAATLLQVLYEMYAIFVRTRTRSNRDKGSALVAVGIASYIFWFIGTYIILFLSRTREYLADRFSAEATGNPNALSMALIKIAYGIAEQPDTVETRRLLVSTRAMGIYDFKAAEHVGGGFKMLTETQTVAAQETMTEQKPSEKPFYGATKLSKIFLFDLYNPWAKVAEISSTHPLTGKRIGMLNSYAPEFKKAPLFDFAMIDAQGRQLDKSRLYGKFFFEVLIYFAPYLGLLAGLLAAFALPSMMGAAVQGAGAGAGVAGLPILFFGIGMLLKGFYQFPSQQGVPRKTTVFELMCDAYASPLHGQFVEVQGKIIGRAEAGSTISEDMMMQDKSGGLIVLNYESPVPFLGNFFFGWRKAGKMEGQSGTAVGWFRRSIGQILDLQTFASSAETIKSYTRFWGMFGGAVVALIGVAVLLASAAVK